LLIPTGLYEAIARFFQQLIACREKHVSSFHDSFDYVLDERQKEVFPDNIYFIVALFLDNVIYLFIHLLAVTYMLSFLCGNYN